MGLLHVDVRALERLRTGLRRAAHELQGCGRTLSSARASQLGSPVLDDACDDFFRAWGHGTDLLGEAADAVRAQLDEALRAYDAVDASLAEVFRSAGP